MGQPLTLDEVGVSPEDAAQVIYDLRRRVAAAEEVIAAELAYREARNHPRPGLKKEASERRNAARAAWKALVIADDIRRREA